MRRLVLVTSTRGESTTVLPVPNISPPLAVLVRAVLVKERAFTYKNSVAFIFHFVK